jgi:hypothetical protein
MLDTGNFGLFGKTSSFHTYMLVYLPNSQPNSIQTEILLDKMNDCEEGRNKEQQHRTFVDVYNKIT